MMGYVCSHCSSTISYSQEVIIGNMHCHLHCAISQAETVKRTYQDSLLRYPNVIGVGVGWRYKRYWGFDKREICIVVNVSKRLPESQLMTTQIVPKYVGVIKTDVLETHEIIAPRPIGVAIYERRRKRRPAEGGVSVGHIRGATGTLGCRVRRGYESLILSNNHILANEGEAYYGDSILQPGPADGGGDPDDRLAYLGHCIPISFGYGLNYADAAIARPISPDVVSSEVLDIGVPTGVTTVALGMRVVKSGRTTGKTSGEVVQVGATLWISYRRGSSSLCRSSHNTSRLFFRGRR